MVINQRRFFSFQRKTTIRAVIIRISVKYLNKSTKLNKHTKQTVKKSK